MLGSLGAFIPSTEAMAIPAVSKGGVEGPAGTAVAVPLSISLRLHRSRFTTLWTRPQTHSDWGRDQTTFEITYLYSYPMMSMYKFLESSTRLYTPVFLLLFKLNLCGLE